MPFELRVLQSRAGEAELILDGEIIPLQIGQYSPWTKISFKAGLGIKVQGICRFLLLETDPDIRLYVTPIQIDPEKPALPISYPSAYSIYLAKSQGTFATLGVAEDTSGLNENILDEAAFLRQCYDIHKEREMMFFDALEKTPEGCVVCVFDITDRVQHMFMRCLDGGHPANRGRDIHPYRDTIRELYQRMDDWWVDLNADPTPWRRRCRPRFNPSAGCENAWLNQTGTWGEIARREGTCCRMIGPRPVRTRWIWRDYLNSPAGRVRHCQSRENGGGVET